MKHAVSRSFREFVDNLRLAGAEGQLADGSGCPKTCLIRRSPVSTQDARSDYGQRLFTVNFGPSSMAGTCGFRGTITLTTASARLPATSVTWTKMV